LTLAGAEKKRAEWHTDAIGTSGTYQDSDELYRLTLRSSNRHQSPVFHAAEHNHENNDQPVKRWERAASCTRVGIFIGRPASIRLQ
jgi:hypothetical protein